MKYFNNQFDDERYSHIVKDKESLYNIAKQYNVSIEDLKKANNLENNLIYPNQALLIPKQNDQYKTYFTEYVTTSGDTLSNIASKYDVQIDDLLKYNDLGKFMFEKNQIMNIKNNDKVYVISERDNLYSILYNINTSLEDLISNNYNVLFKPGTKLYVNK